MAAVLLLAYISFLIWPGEDGSIVGWRLYAFGAVGLLLSLLIMPLSGSAARLLQAPEEAYDATRDYLFICGAGTVFIVA